MSCSPQDTYKVASVLRASDSSEAALRAVTNRAYYASYHAAKEFHSSLKSPGSVQNSSGSHEQLITQLDNPTLGKTDKEYWLSKGISKTLRIAYVHRISADYYPATEFNDKHADEALSVTGQVIAKALAIPFP